MRICRIAVAWIGWAWIAGLAVADLPSVPLEYRGMSDASAAIAVNDDHFLIADDERNVLQLYTIAQPGLPVASWNWDEPLGLSDQVEPLEADVEGVTRLGDLTLWVSSHGRNLSGKWRPSRHQFFATRLEKTGDAWELKPVGQAYHLLALHLAADARYARLGVRDALGQPGKTEKELAPKEGGFNIEGLAASPDGTVVWLGLRNPLAEGRAILAPLLNAREILLEAASPRFGDPITLPLHVRWQQRESQLGIRSLEYSPHLGAYVIVAGPVDNEKVFALYRWNGQPEQRPMLLPQTGRVLATTGFTPEALVLFAQRNEFLLLSDDGSKRVRVGSKRECQPGTFEDGMCEQKFLLDFRRQTFTGLILPVQP